jgi:hypothetical protein
MTYKHSSLLLARLTSAFFGSLRHGTVETRSLHGVTRHTIYIYIYIYIYGSTPRSAGILSGSCSGRAALEGGADVAVGEDHSVTGKWRHEHSPRKKRNGEAPLGYSGRTALRREQCDMSNYSWVAQLVSRHRKVNKISAQTRCHATLLEYGSYATCRGDVTRQQE